MRGTDIATVAHNARNREQAQLAYTIDRACKLWPAVENTLMNCWESISLRNTNACSVSCEATMRGRGGPITATVDVPGGPILAGDHRRRDRPWLITPARLWIPLHLPSTGFRTGTFSRKQRGCLK